MKKPFLTATLLALTLPLAALADSPLTSTTFYKAFLDIESGPKALPHLLEKASKSHILDEDMFEFFSDPEIPFLAKLTLVNALGWQKGAAETPNSSRFLDAVVTVKGIDVADASRKLSAEELTIYAYMKALENYDKESVLPSLASVLEAAVEKQPDSYGVNLAKTLVDCQVIFDADDWKGVWKRYLALEGNDKLKDPLPPEAVKIIRDYLQLYENG